MNDKPTTESASKIKRLILRVKLPLNAYDVRLGTDMMTEGLLFKSPKVAHFVSFGDKTTGKLDLSYRRKNAELVVCGDVATISA